MLKVVFEARDISELKLQIQEYGLTHLGLAFLKQAAPPPPAEKRGPGRPRKLRPEDLRPRPTPEVSIPITTEPQPIKVNQSMVKAALDAYIKRHGHEEAVEVLSDFGAFNLEEVNVDDYEALRNRLNESTVPA